MPAVTKVEQWVRLDVRRGEESIGQEERIVRRTDGTDAVNIIAAYVHVMRRPFILKDTISGAIM
jgi:hypothetical protein